MQALMTTLAQGASDLARGPIVLLLVKASLLLAAAAVASLLLSRSSPDRRHRVWAMGLASVLLLPVVSTWMPRWPLPILADAEEMAATVSSFEGETARSRRSSADAPPTVGRSPIPEELGHRRVVPSPRALESRQVWLIAWLLGSLLVLIRLFIGHGKLWALARNSVPMAGEPWQESLRETARAVGIRRHLKLLVNEGEVTPMTWGLWRPLVLLPSSARGWSEARRRIVLQHELVHVARHDWALRLLGQVACVAYWFHPLAWIASRRLAAEQELACDDRVLALGIKPSAYARELLTLARESFPQLRRVPAFAMVRRSNLEIRMVRILSPSDHRHSTLLVVPVLLLLGGLLPLLAAVEPMPRGSGEPFALRGALRTVGSVSSTQESSPVSVSVSVTPALAQSTRPTAATAASPQSVGELVAELERLEASLAPFEAQLEQLEVEIEQRETQIEPLEEALEPLEHQLEAIEVELEPFQEQLEAIEEETLPFEEQLEAIEAEMESVEPLGDEIEEAMEPLEDQMERLEEEMEPLLEKLEPLAEEQEQWAFELEGLRRKLAQATPEERQRLRQEIEQTEKEVGRLSEEMDALQSQLEPFHSRMGEIHEQMEPLHRRMEALHDQLEPFHRQMQAVYEQMEPLHLRQREVHAQMRQVHERMRAVHGRMRPIHADIRDVHQGTRPTHRQMREIHRQMREIQRQMRVVGERLEASVTAEIRSLLARELAGTGLSESLLDEAAAAVGQRIQLRSEGGHLEIESSPSSVRRSLERTLAPSGTVDDDLEARLERAAEAIAHLEISGAA